MRIPSAFSPLQDILIKTSLDDQWVIGPVQNGGKTVVFMGVYDSTGKFITNGEVDMAEIPRLIQYLQSMQAKLIDEEKESK